MNIPKPPFHSAMEELLYGIYQKLPDVTYLTASDINTLSKLNALLTDGQILSADDVTDILNQFQKRNRMPVGDGTEAGNKEIFVNDGSPLNQEPRLRFDEDLKRWQFSNNGNTFKNLVDIGTAFPSTFFVSSIGNDNTGEKGDFTRPFTVAGALQRIASGESMLFLDGTYNIAGNIAKNGIRFGTFGGDVMINISEAITLFDFSTLEESNDPVFIAGDFQFQVLGPNSRVFNFAKGFAARDYYIRWKSVVQYEGSFLNMPVRLSTGLFEGNISLINTATLPAITCDPNGCNGAGTIRCSVFNASNTTYAITPLFVGFTLIINFLSTGKGLFSAPAGASSAANKGTLTINQPATADTYLFDGDFDVSVVGGIIETTNGSFISLKGNLRDCEFRARPQTFISAYLTARDIKVLNDQVYILQLDGIYYNCEYMRTSTSLTVLNGTFFNFKPQYSVSLLRINGYVLLAPEVSLQVYGGETLEVNGKLVGNADTIIYIGQTSSVIITGQVRNHQNGGSIIKSGNAGYALNLHLKNVVLQAGLNAPYSILIQPNDTLTLKVYGQSSASHPVQGNTVFAVGSSNDLIIDTDVEVIP